MSGRVTPPFPALHGGNCDDLSTAVEGDTIVMGSNGRFAPGAGGPGGGGISVTGTPTYGEVPSWDDASDVYRPRKPGSPVFRLTDYGARGIASQTTGAINSGEDALTVADATGWSVGNELAVHGAGAAHGLSAPSAPFPFAIGTTGATSYRMRVSALSGDGGQTQVGSATTATDGNATLSTTNKIRWFVDCVTGARGYVFYGRSTTDGNHYAVTAINGRPTALKIQFDAAGYTNAVTGDIGKTVVQGSNDGVLLGYDNTARVWWVDPTVWNTDTFANSAVSVTITTGTGAGTQTSAATNATYFDDCGDAATTDFYPPFARRNSTAGFVGEWMLYPVSSSGNFYQCSAEWGDRLSNSSAPTFSTTLGATTTDGNKQWTRRNPAYSVTPPAADVNNVLRASITDVTGSVLTLSASASATVSGATVTPDDFSALQAATNAAKASGSVNAIVDFSGLDCMILPGTPEDDGVGNDSRWGVLANGGNDYLFSIVNPSPGVNRKIEYHGHGGTIWAGYLDAPGRMVDDSANAALTDVRTFFYLTSGELILRGGRYIFTPMGEPVIEHADAWNFNYFIENQGKIQGGPQAYGVEVHAWPRTTLMSDTRGYGRGEKWIDCYVTYGGAGHDAGWYTKGGTWTRTFAGGRRRDRSLGIYHDENTITLPLYINHCHFENFRQNGIRVRVDGSRITNSRFWDFENFIFSSGAGNLVFANNDCERCFFNLSGASRVKFIGNNLSDCAISMSSTSSAIKLIGNDIIATAASSSIFGEAKLVTLDGTDIRCDGNTIDGRSFGGSTMRALLTQGTGIISFNSNHLYGKGAWGYQSTATGTVRIKNNYIYSSAGPSAHQINGAGVYKCSGNTWDNPTSTNEISINNAGRIEFVGDTFLSALAVYSGITGPAYFTRCQFLSASPSTFLKAGTVLDGNNFAVAPTLSAAALTTKNLVADSPIASPTALASGTTNNYQLPVTDYVRLDPNAANSTLSGLVAFSGGTEKVLLNADAAAAQVILDDSGGGSSAANQFAFGATTLDTNDLATIWYDSTASLWMLKSVTP